MRGYPFVSPIKESQEKKVTDKEQEEIDYWELYEAGGLKELIKKASRNIEKDKEQEKRHLYAKLLSVISDEDRLKYEKALANILTKKRGS
tara:strand:+ start:73 stop:342 length:270 start_codon:yes stop_codon:yes gene_type:complete